MASRNGHTVFDLVSDSYKRKVQELGGGPSVGHSIPADLRQEAGIQVGDEVVIREAPDDSDALYEVFVE
ncbi:MAG: AbrB/MazE/SpoVT family DNA-binding domain-containing protein [Natronomonas sp.]